LALMLMMPWLHNYSYYVERLALRDVVQSPSLQTRHTRGECAASTSAGGTARDQLQLIGKYPEVPDDGDDVVEIHMAVE
jgi:hypothetical protein